MIKTNRREDVKRELEVEKFLDKYVYLDDIFTKKERVDDKDEQIKGTDIILSMPLYKLENITVDEKAAITRWDSELKTFILELSFLNIHGDPMDGWFVDHKKTNTHYGFVWLRATKKDFTCDDIYQLDYALVNKNKIKEWLASYGCSVELLKRNADVIRERGYIKKDFSRPFHLSYSPQFGEQPINIVVPKEVYFELSDYKVQIDFSDKVLKDKSVVSATQK